jgi:hypothetical protein
MIVISYGSYSNYRLQQIPDAFLAELKQRFPLTHEAASGLEHNDLQITIAVHEEVERRRNGGQVFNKAPSSQELATKLIGKGYQALSKDHHPDRKGGTEIAQKRLNAVREQLLEACKEIEDEYPEDTLQIHAPYQEISDEDIPF